MHLALTPPDDGDSHQHLERSIAPEAIFFSFASAPQSLKQR